LTDHELADRHPSICADGRKITETEDVNNFDPDCGPVTASPFWIVFVRDGDGDIETTDDNEVCKIKSDGTGFAQLTDNDDDDTEPVWCGSSVIAFASNRSGNYEIYTMDVNGGSVLNRSNLSGENRTPACKLDGSKIAWAHKPALGNFDIWTMDADGSDQGNLDTGSLDDMEPSWAPSGSQIIYTVFGSSYRSLYITNADGEGDPVQGRLLLQLRQSRLGRGESGVGWPPLHEDGMRAVRLLVLGCVLSPLVCARAAEGTGPAEGVGSVQAPAPFASLIQMNRVAIIMPRPLPAR